MHSVCSVLRQASDVVTNEFYNPIICSLPFPNYGMKLGERPLCLELLRLELYFFSLLLYAYYLVASFIEHVFENLLIAYLVFVCC